MARLEEFDDVQLDVEFTQAGARSNLTSNENIAISFGKIAKWYEALVPTGGSSGQFLGFNSSGTAKWVSNPNVDEKVKATKLAQSTVEASYYPTLVAGEGTAGVSIIDSAKINHTPGTTSIVGNTCLILGNGINEGTTNNEAGLLRIYSSGTKYHTLKGAKITTDNVEHTLPTTGGTILNTGTTSFTQTLSSGTKIGTIKINGTSSDIYAPTNTDTKVTSSANHYAPATVSGQDKSASASGATAAWSIDVVKGVTLNTDGKGHVTGLSVTSGKIPANPIPSNNVTGSGTSGYLTKWNGTNTITNGPQLGSSTTTFLRNDGTWATPTNTDTKVTQSATITTNYRPILFGAKDSTDISTLANTVTDQAYTSTKMFAKPDTGILYASGFSTSSFINGTGAQLNQYGLYLKSYKSASLPAGGNYSYEEYAIRVYDGKSMDNNGMLLTIDGGGLTIVGGGESAKSLAALISDDQRDSNTSRTRLDVGGTLNTAYHGSEEQLILSSDNNIYFLTTCQTIANRKPVVLDVNSYFYPGTTKTGSIGTSSYMWNSVYAATIYENGTSLASKYAAIGHTHSYLPLAGGTMTGDITFATISGDPYPISSKGIKWGGGTDAIDMYYNLRASDAGELIINMRDDSNVRTSFAYNGTVKSYIDTNGTYNGNASKTGIRWNAVSQGQKWSRLYYSETAVNVEGSNGILSISCTRGNVVVNAVFLVFVSHPGPNASHIIELASTNYSTIRCRVVSNSAGSYYFEIYDTANNIASGTSQAWHCCFVTLTDATLTTYTTFTDGSTIPSNFAAANDFTTTVGKASAAIKDISRSGTTFTATRQDGTTFTFTQQDNNTTYTVATGDSNGQIKVTPSSGSAYNVSVKGLASAAYTASTDYLSSSTKYAGSSSAGGAATSANKLNTNAGATNRPVYFSGGVPVQCDAPESGSFFKGVPLIGTNGVMEIGRYIDFHTTNASTADYDYRIDTTTTAMTLHATGSSNTLTINSSGNAQLSFQTTSSGKAYTASGVTCYPLGTTGMTALFNFGGNVVIGGGEAAKTLYDNDYDTIKSSERETLYLASDSEEIHLITDAQTYANRKVLRIIGGQLTKSGGSFIAARDHAPVYSYKGGDGTSGSFYPAIFSKSKTGGWAIGTIGNDDNFYVSYTTDANYSSNTNTSTYTIQFPKDSGTLALTSSNITGTSANVTGTVAIAHGGTGATTRLAALRALTEQDVGTSAQYFLTITDSWGKGGYTSVANAKTVLGLGSAAYTESTDYLSSSTEIVLRRGNAGKSNMNDVGRLHASVGMTYLSDPGNNYDNPMNGTTKSTNWHLYWDASYKDDPNGSNSWVAQIVNKAGTAQWWVRSREGGTITNGTEWAAGWEHLTITSQAGAGSATNPVYVDSNGHTQACTYSLNKSVPSNAVFTDHITTATSSGSGNAVTAISADANGALTVTKGSTFSLSTHTHNYAGSSSAGGPATNVAIARVSKDSKAFPGANKVVFEEYTNGGNYNLPGNHYYHIMSAQGNDTNYGTQLALGMTATAAYYRVYNNKTWSDWKSLINTDTTYSANNGVGLSGTTFYNSGVRAVSTGSANGTISVNTNGTSADVAVKGLASAAYTASTDYLSSSTKYAGSSSAGGAATSANILNKNNTAGATTAGVQYANGQLTVGTADGNAVEGSNGSYKLWSYPAGGTAVGGGTANIQNLRLYWSSTYFRDIFISPNNYDIYHRSVAAGTAQPWRKLLDSGNYTSYALPRNIKHIHTASGTEGSAGWVKIARITVTAAYANHPMTFTIAQRDIMQYRIHLVLVNNKSVAAAAISEFIIARDNSWTDTNNYPRAYIIKPSDGIFDLYIRKIEAYDHIFVVDFTKADGSEGDNYSVTWTNVHAADSEITGGTEAVKKLYLPTSGGTMTGTITHPANTVAINLRADGTSTWQNTIMTQSAGDEAVVFANANARTSWIFVNGEDSIAHPENNRWQSLTPALQIKGGCVAIGKLIPSGTTPTTRLDIAGSTALTGDIQLKTSGSSSDDSGDIVWYYGNGRAKARLWQDNAYTAKAGPLYAVSKSDGTNLYSGRLPLADGTSASGTWGISITGNAATATKATQDADGNTISSTYLKLSGGTMTGELKQQLQLRVYCGNYGTIIRSDGSNTYFLVTDSGSAESGNWNSLRPLYFSNSTGKVTMGNGAEMYSSGYGALSIIRTNGINAGIKFYNNSSTYLGSLALGTANGRFVRFKTDEATSYEIIDTSLLNVTESANLGLDGGTNAFGYVSGLTKAAWNFQQTDGTIIRQFYNANWKSEIYMDYRTGQMSTRSKNNGTWQDWRIHLDSGNFSSYAVPIKTGDGIAKCSGNGEYLYYTIATITISGTYVNKPILFEISGRGHHFTRLEVEFASSSSTDPGLDTNGFVADGYHGFWIKKTATSTWAVYGMYSEKWGNAVLHRITGCGTSEVTVTVNMTNYGNSLPDGCTQVTYGWMALLADRALRADKASKLSTSSAIGSDTQPVYFDSDGYPTACYPMSRTSTIYDNSSGTSTIISDLIIPADTKYFKIFIFDFNTSGSHYVTNVIDIGVDDGYYGGVISGSSQSQSFPCVITVVQLIVATTSNNRKQISIGRSNSWTIGASPSSSTHTLYIRKIIACT